MIKARTRIGARDTVVFGLTDENWGRLRAGQPILINGLLLGCPGVQFLILGGESNEDIIEDLRSVGVTSKVRVESVGEPG
jgi:hypothetical protein